MNPITALAALAALALFLGLPVHAGTPEIGDDINARLARAKSQQAAEVAARVRAGDASAAAAGNAGTNAGTNAGISTLPGNGQGCTIAIGTVFEDKARPIGTSARRETTVIVTGDVIQVGNTCR